jgi:2,4-dienoyl-CoA reductase-like NADH-dependent reductase (Old Yellow Enzyme family)
MIEVAEAAASVFGADRVGMHLAPRGDVMSMSDPDPAAIFTYVAQQLGQRKLAFLLAREYEAPGWLGPQLKQAFGGVYMANEKFTRESADAAIERGDCDAVAFGHRIIAHPHRSGNVLHPRAGGLCRLSGALEHFSYRYRLCHRKQNADSLRE